MTENIPDIVDNREISAKIAEFSSLRDEILRSDRTCLLITGSLITIVGVLFNIDQQWLTSFFSFIGLCYFTEKRFIIRQLATYIDENLEAVSLWERRIKKLRKSQPGLRPTNLLRPYNSEIVICLSIALLALFSSNMPDMPSMREQLIQNDLFDNSIEYIVWFIFFLIIVYLSIVNWIQYNYQEYFNRGSSIIALRIISIFLTTFIGFLLTKNPLICFKLSVAIVLVPFLLEQLLNQLFRALRALSNLGCKTDRN